MLYTQPLECCGACIARLAILTVAGVGLALIVLAGKFVHLERVFRLRDIEIAAVRVSRELEGELVVAVVIVTTKVDRGRRVHWASATPATDSGRGQGGRLAQRLGGGRCRASCDAELVEHGQLVFNTDWVVGGSSAGSGRNGSVACRYKRECRVRDDRLGRLATLATLAPNRVQHGLLLGDRRGLSGLFDDALVDTGASRRFLFISTKYFMM